MRTTALLVSAFALALATAYAALGHETDDRPPRHEPDSPDAESHARIAHATDLITSMGRLQYFAHKLGLAVSAGNRPLQAFYLHEAEEVIEAVEHIEQHDGIEIASLLRQNLIPPLEALKAEIQSGDGARIDGAYDALLTGCNACHKAANRPYIHIRRRTDNPYMQDFAPAP